mmetsp:Transcript_17426/g.45249  ORF Transcript_17426/g.45249 Transcript_17426/m.45249 type:complete len:534 (+) Transcript_17426:192-1793(+)
MSATEVDTPTKVEGMLEAEVEGRAALTPTVEGMLEAEVEGRATLTPTVEGMLEAEVEGRAALTPTPPLRDAPAAPAADMPAVEGHAPEEELEEVEPKDAEPTDGTGPTTAVTTEPPSDAATTAVEVKESGAPAAAAAVAEEEEEAEVDGGPGEPQSPEPQPPAVLELDQLLGDAGSTRVAEAPNDEEVFATEGPVTLQQEGTDAAKSSPGRVMPRASCAESSLRHAPEDAAVVSGREYTPFDNAEDYEGHLKHQSFSTGNMMPHQESLGPMVELRHKYASLSRLGVTENLVGIVKEYDQLLDKSNVVQELIACHKNKLSLLRTRALLKLITDHRSILINDVPSMSHEEPQLGDDTANAYTMLEEEPQLMSVVMRWLAFVAERVRSAQKPSIGDFMVWEDDMKRGVEETTSQSLLHHLHEYRTGQIQDRFAVQLQCEMMLEPYPRLLLRFEDVFCLVKPLTWWEMIDSGHKSIDAERPIPASTTQASKDVAAMMHSMTGSIPAECYARPRDLDFLHEAKDKSISRKRRSKQGIK